MILVDTNVLLRIVQPSHSMHAMALMAVGNLRLANESLCLVPQILYEFWVVATRPVDPNGLGMTLAEAEADVTRLMQRFRLFRDERAIFERWHELVVQHRVLGKGAHDARLVAAMERHRLTRILTFNVDDFKRYPGIEVLAPAEVANQ
jgi:predicted nucleic acid-binding protein